MPATKRGKRAPTHVFGVDGCRAGWVAARLNLDDNRLEAKFGFQFRDIVKLVENARMVMVDMPIGLGDETARPCEAAARKLLSPLRHSSVFSPPRRQMLNFEEYSEANAWGKAQQKKLTGSEAGGGLSKQAWMITPKIREVDAVMTPDLQKRICEAHPEIAFWRLNNRTPCTHSKRTAQGREERQVLLAKSGLNPDPLFQSLKQAASGGAGLDDLYDACALALTAKARLNGKAVHLGDDKCDARGLLKEIWG